MKKYIAASLLCFTLVGCQSKPMNDLKDGIHDIGEKADDLTGKEYNRYGLSLDELKTVPSFCNATFGTPLFPS